MSLRLLKVVLIGGVIAGGGYVLVKGRVPWPTVAGTSPGAAPWVRPVTPAEKEAAAMALVTKYVEALQEGSVEKMLAVVDVPWVGGGIEPEGRGEAVRSWADLAAGFTSKMRQWQSLRTRGEFAHYRPLWAKPWKKVWPDDTVAIARFRVARENGYVAAVGSGVADESVFYVFVRFDEDGEKVVGVLGAG